MLKLKGVVSSGLEEASLFMKNEVYMKQYVEKLGFEPELGTLNIKLMKDIDINIKEEYESELKIIHGNEKLGDVYFLMANLYTSDKSICKNCAILFPSMTVHKYDTLEFVSDEKLRDSMNLIDGSCVIIEIP